jgi:hypothetical protein
MDSETKPVAIGMKRLTYISKLNALMTTDEIIEIGRISSVNNRKVDVTGVLICAGDYFFQILEGEETIVDQLLEKISHDHRHNEITILSSEYECEERLFSDWDMKTVAITESTDLMLQAVGMMLQNIAQSYHIIGRYTQPVLLKLLTEGINPLTVPIKNSSKIVVSGRMSDFSSLAKHFSGPEFIDTFNEYLEICSASFIEFGGQVGRYSRSGIIAHFASDQFDTAIAACQDAYKKLRMMVSDSPKLRSIEFGFGIVGGVMIEGNIGSSIKMDYTVLGDTVNEAVHLAALALDKTKAVAIDESLLANSEPSWGFEHLGEYEFNDSNKLIQVGSLARFGVSFA